MNSGAPYAAVVGAPFMGTTHGGHVHRNATTGLQELKKSNLIATTDPTVGDDTDDGYAVGSQWINVSSGSVFTCTNAAAGAANWTLLGGGSGVGIPAGTGTEVQYRVNATTFGAVAGSSWDATTLTLPKTTFSSSIKLGYDAAIAVDFPAGQAIRTVGTVTGTVYFDTGNLVLRRGDATAGHCLRIRGSAVIGSMLYMSTPLTDGLIVEGYVGIGIASGLGNILHVRGTANQTGLRVDSGPSYTCSVVELYNANTGATAARNWRLASNYTANGMFEIQRSLFVDAAATTTALAFDSSGNVGIGTGATVSARLHVISTTEQMRLGYDATKYASFTVDNSGDMTIAPSGANLAITADVDVPSDKAFYLGAPATDGTWRITRSGNNLLMERRESGAYVTKQTIAA